MRLDRFDLNLLVVLDVLLEERNVTRAGERLHIGQSATSAALRRLRDYFGDELLVPAGRRLEPTPLAMSLVAPVRDALLRARAAMSLRPSFDPAVASRRFVICASDYAISVLLAQAIGRIARLAPGIRIELRRPPGDIEESFERGNIDLIVLPEQYAMKLDHPNQQLLSDTHVCMVCNNHPLAAEDLTMDRYLDLGHVAVRLGEEGSIAFEEWFLPRYGRQRRVECTVDYFSAVPMLLLGTDRIATLHERLARDMARRFPLTLKTAPFQMQPLVEYLVWPRYMLQDPAHRWLREEILATAADLQHDTTA